MNESRVQWRESPVTDASPIKVAGIDSKINSESSIRHRKKMNNAIDIDNETIRRNSFEKILRESASLMFGDDIQLEPLPNVQEGDSSDPTRFDSDSLNLEQSNIHISTSSREENNVKSSTSKKIDVLDTRKNMKPIVLSNTQHPQSLRQLYDLLLSVEQRFPSSGKEFPSFANLTDEVCSYDSFLQNHEALIQNSVFKDSQST